MFPRRPPLDEVLSIWKSLIAKEGITTAPGAPAGTSFIDSALIGSGANSFTNMGVVLYPGDPERVDARAVSGFNNATGEVTLDSAYKGVVAAIPAGVAYILVPLIVAGGVAAILAALALIKAKTDKLFVSTVASGSVVANWQAAEQNLVTIGANDVKNQVHLLVVGIQNLAGNITIRLYMQVNGTERRIYPIPANTTFSVALDAPAIPVINASMKTHEALRVTVQSDNAADNGKSVDYDYMLEAM